MLIKPGPAISVFSATSERSACSNTFCANSRGFKPSFLAAAIIPFAW